MLADPVWNVFKERQEKTVRSVAFSFFPGDVNVKKIMVGGLELNKRFVYLDQIFPR